MRNDHTSNLRHDAAAAAAAADDDDDNVMY
jgi:hypothetical protein